MKLHLKRVTSISHSFLMHRCPLRVYLRLAVFLAAEAYSLVNKGIIPRTQTIGYCFAHLS